MKIALELVCWSCASQKLTGALGIIKRTDDFLDIFAKQRWRALLAALIETYLPDRTKASACAYEFCRKAPHIRLSVQRPARAENRFDFLHRTRTLLEHATSGCDIASDRLERRLGIEAPRLP